MKNILAIRFSAMGDVAMTVPVIMNVLGQNPDLKITFLSNAAFKPLFQDIDRCHFIGADTKNAHKGFSGLFRLYKEISSTQRFDFVADLHNVLRSNVIDSFFWASGVPAHKIDKGRDEKKELTRKENKVLKQLTTSHQRYANVFKDAGIPVVLQPMFLPKKEMPKTFLEEVPSDKKRIGIAPFAKHQPKTYPLEKMKSFVEQLHAQNKFQIVFFGGGNDETKILQEWSQEFEGTYCAAGKFSFAEELAIISDLDAMVSMDSANMHLASLYNVPVVSVWGATHMFAGFYGWQQNPQNAVQIDLYCRPCSVFGNKPCYRGDHACMEELDKALIYQKVNELVH